MLLQACLHVTTRLLEFNRTVLPPLSDILSTDPITYVVNLSIPQLWFCRALNINENYSLLFNRYFVRNL